MVREKDVLNLIGNIYDAALNMSHWPSVLQHLVRLTHSNAGNLAELGLSSGATTPIASVAMPRSSFSDYETHYSHADTSDNEHLENTTHASVSQDRHQPASPTCPTRAADRGDNYRGRIRSRWSHERVLILFITQLGVAQ